jgi:signal transduction histidine kinase
VAALNQEFLSIFQNLDLFRELPVEDLAQFLTECREETFGPDWLVFKEGDAPDRFYVLLEGEVEIWKSYGSPQADVLAVRGPGASFGEMSLIDELPRSATVKTLTPVRLLSLEKPHFRKIMEDKPQVAMLIMKTVSQMVRLSNDAFQYGLMEKNLMLAKAYDELQRAHNDLIRAERLSTLGKFSSMIIHDLRNPISIIRAYAEALTMARDAEAKTAMASKLLAETDRLNRMVGELLDYTRGNIRLNLGPVRLHDMFERLREQFERGGGKIALEFDNAVGAPLLLDSDRVYRVLANLLDNGRKAMRHRGVLKIRAYVEETQAVVEVADTGEGMDEETRARLFEPFFSASSAGGTGLGMLVVQNVVEAHGGSVEVESERGVGTTVKVSFPLKLELV